MKIYKVGGAVRDHIMGVKPNDSDWVVVGSTPEEMSILGYKQVGADFQFFYILKPMKSMHWQELRKKLAKAIQVSQCNTKRIFHLKKIY